jgi:type I restriction enzyme S subunit
MTANDSKLTRRPYFHKVRVAPFHGLCSADTLVIRTGRRGHSAGVVACVSSNALVAEANATANGAKMPRANWDVLEKFPVVISKSEVVRQQVLTFQIQNLRRTRDLLRPGEVNLL